MTVLSCLWLFENPSPFGYIFNKFWPNTKNYHPIVKNLGITPEIAKYSYVTDFARVANHAGRRDTAKSRALLLKEIELLDPELVVLVGAEPRNAFSNELLKYPEKFIQVPFSLKGVSKQTQKEGPVLYKNLRERLSVQ